MSNRRLSHQQKRRIASRQQQLRGKRAPDDETGAFGELQGGLVISRHSTMAEVVADESVAGAPPCRCHIRANVTDIVTGDRVIWRPGDPTGIIESVLPRQTLMSRPDARGQLRPVAANVDQIAVVIACEPPPHQNLVDRYLVAIEHLGITPLIVVNKTDLPERVAGTVSSLRSLYLGLGYRVLAVSATGGGGMELLGDALRHHTTVVVGQSGVGKSSLIKSLNPAAEAETGDLSLVAKGRHTTTATRFYVLPGGGNLIDSPGIREFGLVHLQPAEVASGFVEFRPLLGSCRFRDCRHLDEQGCAIADAVNAGILGEERWQSYRQIIQSPGAKKGR